MKQRLAGLSLIVVLNLGFLSVGSEGFSREMITKTRFESFRSFQVKLAVSATEYSLGDEVSLRTVGDANEGGYFQVTCAPNEYVREIDIETGDQVADIAVGCENIARLKSNPSSLKVTTASGRPINFLTFSKNVAPAGYVFDRWEVHADSDPLGISGFVPMASDLSGKTWVAPWHEVSGQGLESCPGGYVLTGVHGTYDPESNSSRHIFSLGGTCRRLVAE